jgi:ribonuclease HII
MPSLEYEHQHPGPVCGIDEAGRGPWAGPVSAAAVILDPANIPTGLNDSKKLTHAQREALYDAIIATAHVGHAFVHAGEIDRINILQATYLAMQRAVAALPVTPAYALVDGNRLPHLPCKAQAIVKGDSLSLSIAAASIIAKVLRDRWMANADRQYPGYSFAQHKGYGVPAHSAALTALGPCPIHRMSFKPVRAATHVIHTF